MHVARVGKGFVDTVRGFLVAATEGLAFNLHAGFQLSVYWSLAPDSILGDCIAISTAAAAKQGSTLTVAKEALRCVRQDFIRAAYIVAQRATCCGRRHDSSRRGVTFHNLKLRGSRGTAVGCLGGWFGKGTFPPRLQATCTAPEVSTGIS